MLKELNRELQQSEVGSWCSPRSPTRLPLHSCENCYFVYAVLFWSSPCSLRYSSVPAVFVCMREPPPQSQSTPSFPQFCRPVLSVYHTSYVALARLRLHVGHVPWLVREGVVWGYGTCPLDNRSRNVGGSRSGAPPTLTNWVDYCATTATSQVDFFQWSLPPLQVNLCSRAFLFNADGAPWGRSARVVGESGGENM